MLFQAARHWVIGLLQKITFENWLPKLIGQSAWNRFIGEYSGYDASRDARIPNEFSNAAFRIGHTLLVPNYPQIKADGTYDEVLTLKGMF